MLPPLTGFPFRLKYDTIHTSTTSLVPAFPALCLQHTFRVRHVRFQTFSGLVWLSCGKHHTQRKQHTLGITDTVTPHKNRQSSHHVAHATQCSHECRCWEEKQKKRKCLLGCFSLCQGSCAAGLGRHEGMICSGSGFTSSSRLAAIGPWVA